MDPYKDIHSMLFQFYYAEKILAPSESDSVAWMKVAYSLGFALEHVLGKYEPDIPFEVSCTKALDESSERVAKITQLMSGKGEDE